MAQVGKLYNYYLKKNVWWNWRLWIAVVLCWAWWVSVPLLTSWIVSNVAHITITDDQGRSQRMELSEDDKKFIQEEYKFKALLKNGYSGFYLPDEKGIKWWEERAKKTTDPTKKGFCRMVMKTLEKLSEDWKKAQSGDDKEIAWMARYSGSGISFPSVIGGMFNFPLTEFAAGRQEVFSMGFWKLIHFITLTNLGGIAVGWFFAYNLADNLFVKTKKSGEDATVLTLASPIKRSELFFGKSLAFITAFATFTFLGLILPYAAAMLMGPGIPWGAFSVLLLYTTVIGSILFFLFPISIYLFASNFRGVGTLVYYLLMFFTIFWGTIKAILSAASRFSEGDKNKGLYPFMIKMEYWYHHPLVNIGLAVVIGGLLLSLCYYYFQEEDLGN